MSPGDCSEETPLLGGMNLGNEPLTKRRNFALIGVLITTALWLTCLFTKTNLQSTNSLTAAPLYGDHGHGDPCNINATTMEEGSCNANFYLACDKNTSKCRCQAGMYFDVNSGTGRCLAKVGEKCTNYARDRAPIKYCTRDAECLPDASNVLRCYCKGYYVPNFNGTCMASYDGNCSINADCSPNSFLKCGRGQTCTCDFEDNSQVWNVILRQCASLIGAVCTPEGAVKRPCVDPTKSVCEKDGSRVICKCKSGFIPCSRNHRCALPYNGTCRIKADCAGNLVCDRKKKCSCRNPKDQFYDFIKGKCFVYAGRSCMDQEENLMECVEGATCKLVLPERTDIECSCNENFHEENRFCVLNSGISVQSIRFLLFSVAVFSIVKLLFHEFNVFVETSFGLY